METKALRDSITWYSHGNQSNFEILLHGDDITLLISTHDDLFRHMMSHNVSSYVVICGKVILLQMARHTSVAKLLFHILRHMTTH